MGSTRLMELVSQLGDQVGTRRQKARETLAAIGEAAIPQLVDLLESPDDRLRWEGAKALTEIPDAVAIPGLVSLLGDPKSEVRWLAATALIRIGNRSVPLVLQSLTEEAESREFREASHHVFHDLSKRNGVMREILKPVLAVLGDTDPSEVVSTRAEVALREWRALSE